MDLLLVLDYAGVAVFAATGALAASRKELDIIGFVFLANFTGTGGGTIRDLVLGSTPVFWISNPHYILVCTGIAVFVYFTAHLLESRYRALLWFDATGLSAYSVMGAAKGLAATGSIVVATITGLLTATFGGVIRDVIAGEPSVLLKTEIVIVAALIGSSTYTIATLSGLHEVYAISAGVGLAFVTRGGALLHGWSFPRYKSRRGRTEDELRRARFMPSQRR